MKISMKDYSALLDANVLYPAPMRDLMMWLAVDDVIRARWTEDIHREWIEALLRKEPNRSRDALERTRDLMDRSTRDALITGYHELIDGLKLPDPDDRHVLAAAIVGHCDVIVTQNLKDFPRSVLAQYGIEAQHPDNFLVNHLKLSPGGFCGAVYNARVNLKNPPKTVEKYLNTLTEQGLVVTTAELQQYAQLI